jgi:hypothetical protein
MCRSCAPRDGSGTKEWASHDMPDCVPEGHRLGRARLREWRNFFAERSASLLHEARTAGHGAMNQDRYRDFLILIAVVLAIFACAELLIRFEAWDRLQACVSLGRSNCLPPLIFKEYGF